MENGQLVPDLRFPEFEEIWNEVSIENSSEIVTSGSRDWAQYYSDSGAKFIRMTNLNRNGISLLLNDLRYVTLPNKGSDGKRTSLQSGDILISITAELGKIGLIPENLGEAYINQHTALVRPKVSKIYPQFLAYKLSSNKTNIKINRLNDSGAKAGLNLSTIKKFKYLIPCTKEQQKIANFLTAIDQRITKLKQKKAALEQYKKGLMQKIFSQEIRFRNEVGNEFVAWEEKKLGDLFEITSSKRVFQSEWKKSGIPFYRAREIVKLKKDGFVHNDLFISNDLFDNYKKKYGAPKAGDLLVSAVGTLGIVYIVKSNEKLYFKDGNIIWFKSNAYVDSNFIALLFDTRIVKKQISDNASITTVGTYTIVNAKKTKIPFPCKEEQQKIANFLSATDKKITVMGNQITETEAFKKGLLQKMFV